MWFPLLSGAITKYVKQVLENLSQDWHTGSGRIAGGSKHKVKTTYPRLLLFFRRASGYIRWEGTAKFVTVNIEVRVILPKCIAVRANPTI